jgi:hypothetical protein
MYLGTAKKKILRLISYAGNQSIFEFNFMVLLQVLPNQLFEQIMPEMLDFKMQTCLSSHFWMRLKIMCASLWDRKEFELLLLSASTSSIFPQRPDITGTGCALLLPSQHSTKVSRRGFLSWPPGFCWLVANTPLLSPQAKEKLLEKSDAFAICRTLFNPLRAAAAEKLSMGGDYYFFLPYCFLMVLQKQRCWQISQHARQVCVKCK